MMDPTYDNAHITLQTIRTYTMYVLYIMITHYNTKYFERLWDGVVYTLCFTYKDNKTTINVEYNDEITHQMIIGEACEVEFTVDDGQEYVCTGAQLYAVIKDRPYVRLSIDANFNANVHISCDFDATVVGIADVDIVRKNIVISLYIPHVTQRFLKRVIIPRTKWTNIFHIAGSIMEYYGDLAIQYICAKDHRTTCGLFVVTALSIGIIDNKDVILRLIKR